MKILYLSSSAFSDNQTSLLHRFSKQYEIIYGVIFPYKNSNYTPGEIESYCRKHSLSFIPFQLKHRFRNPLVLLTYFKIIRTIKNLKPDVIFFANFDQIYINVLLLLIDKDITIVGMHDVISHSNTAYNRLARLSKKVLLNYFKHFLTYSSIQQCLLKKNYPGKITFRIPLPLIGFGSPKQPSAPERLVTFLFFGFILPYKGLDILLNSIKRIAQGNIKFKIIIAGRCDDWDQEYQGLIDDESFIEKHIRYISNDEIPLFFARADYLILPYRDTTQSGPLMIAYNYNVPVIVSDAEGFKEFFEEGVAGYQFNIADPLGLDHVMLEALNRTSFDYVALKERMGGYVNEKFSFNSIVNAYEDMFDQILSH
jgi:glycosyltransferase involved in cell wall biosynthesis